MTAPNFASGTIWTADNLNIMRGMNSASVDLIYLDPPFNSNRNYEAPIGSKGRPGPPSRMLGRWTILTCMSTVNWLTATRQPIR